MLILGGVGYGAGSNPLAGLPTRWKDYSGHSIQYTIPVNKSLRNHRMQSTTIPIRFPSARTAAGSRVPTGRRARVLTRIHIPALRAPPRNGAPTRPDICWCTTRRLCSLSPRAGAGPRRRRREGTFVRRMTRTLVWLHDCGVCRGGLAGGKARKRSPLRSRASRELFRPLPPASNVRVTTCRLSRW